MLAGRFVVRNDIRLACRAVIADEMQAGNSTALVEPSLPAAMTVGIPVSQYVGDEKPPGATIRPVKNG